MRFLGLKLKFVDHINPDVSSFDIIAINILCHVSLTQCHVYKQHELTINRIPATRLRPPAATSRPNDQLRVVAAS